MDTTSLEISTSLKEYLVSKNLCPRPERNDLFFYKGNQVLILGETQYGFRVIVMSKDGFWVDLIPQDDPDLIKIWTARELNTIIAHYPVSHDPDVSMSECERKGGKIVHKIRYKGEICTSEANNEADAMAKCFLKILGYQEKKSLWSTVVSYFR